VENELKIAPTNGEDSQGWENVEKGTILVIDDEELVRLVAKESLETFGFSVVNCY
jgi:hypothetical protein